VRKLFASAPVGGPLLEELFELAVGTGEGSDEPTATRALLRAMKKIAARSRIVVVVDDVQWLDPVDQASLKSLLSLARMDGGTIRFLLGVRTIVAEPPSAEV
jgi:predicted ATPase